eukprot:Gb_11961 [translate_table: standard]
MENKTQRIAGMLLCNWRSVWIANIILTEMLVYVGILSPERVNGCGLVRVSGAFTVLFVVGMGLVRMFGSSSEKSIKVRTVRGKCKGICWHTPMHDSPPSLSN